jgi:hypothetical protein
LILSIISLVMALGDQRAGATLPALATITTAVLTLVALFDWLDVEDAEPVDVDTTVIGDPDRSEALDGDADLGNVE